MGLEIGAGGPGAAGRTKLAATAAGAPSRGSSLVPGALLSGALHVVLLALTLLEARPARLAFAPPDDEPAIVALDIASLAPPMPDATTATASLPDQVSPARARRARCCAGKAQHRSTVTAAAANDSELALSPPPLGPSEIAAPVDTSSGGEGSSEDGEEMESAPATVAAPEPPTGPTHVASSVAAALRLYDHFPRIPEPLRGRTAEHAMTVDVCVSERGQVSQVSISPTGVEILERTLREAVQTWRYRPLMVRGAPRPFCHMLRVVYRTGSV
jgi:TonB family protein